MTREEPACSELPEAVPGSKGDLVDIALLVVGVRGRRQRSEEKPQIERVTGELSHLASELKKGLLEQAQSPTARELEKQLARIASLALRLSDAIHALPQLNRELLNLAYHNQRGWDEASHALVGLGLGTAPAELASSAIHAAAEQQVESWRSGRILGPVPPDRPGPEKAVQRLLGDPRLFLADQVAQMIGREQGADAVTSDERGSVYEVVGRLWSHATGLDDEGANLRQYVRRGARSAKLKREWRVALDERDRCSAELWKTPSNYLDQQVRETMKRHIEALDAQTHDLSARAHAALWGYEPETRLTPDKN